MNRSDQITLDLQPVPFRSISSHLISHLYLSIRVLVCILVLLFFSSLCVSCFLLLLVLLLSAAILCYTGDLTD